MVFMFLTHFASLQLAFHDLVFTIIIITDKVFYQRISSCRISWFL